MELIWEINDAFPYDGSRFRTITAAFVGSGQERLLENKSFVILAGVDGKTFAKVGTVQGPTNRYLHKGVQSGRLYYYKVAAFDRNGKPWSMSRVTMGAAGPNLFPSSDFEEFEVGSFGGERGVPEQYRMGPPEGLAIAEGHRPYSAGKRILRYDRAWAGLKQVTFDGGKAPVSMDKRYLQGGWVRAPGASGDAWLGRWFYDKEQEPIKVWGYAVMSVRNTPEWTFAVQLLEPDTDGSAVRAMRDGRPHGMIRTHWKFLPTFTSYMAPFVTSFGSGECDDHWLVEITEAPEGAPVLP